MNKRTATLISIFVIGAALFLAGNASAQTVKGTYQLLEPLPCIGGSTCAEGTLLEGISMGETGSKEAKTIPLKDYLQYILNMLIAGSAAAAVFMIVYGGLLYATSETWPGKSNAKDKITHAIYGLLLVLSSYLILKTINPQLVEIPATIVPKLTVDGGRLDRMSGGNKIFFDKLQEEINAKDAAAWETAQKIQDTERAIDDLQKQRTDLASQLKQIEFAAGPDAATEDPTGRQLSSQISNIDNQILREKGERQLLESKYNLDQVVPSPMSGTSWNEFDAFRNIDAVYETEARKLNALGSQEENIKALERYRNFSKRMVNISSQEAKVNQIKMEYENLSWGKQVLASEAEYSRRIAAQRAISVKMMDEISAEYAKSADFDPELAKKMADRIQTAKTNMNSVIVK